MSPKWAKKAHFGDIFYNVFNRRISLIQHWILLVSSHNMAKTATCNKLWDLPPQHEDSMTFKKMSPKLDFQVFPLFKPSPLVLSHLQASDWCHCGDSYGRYGEATNCDNACKGDGGQTCGGSWANNVYPLTDGTNYHAVLKNVAYQKTQTNWHLQIRFLRTLSYRLDLSWLWPLLSNLTTLQHSNATPPRKYFSPSLW